MSFFPFGATRRGPRADLPLPRRRRPALWPRDATPTLLALAVLGAASPCQAAWPDEQIAGNFLCHADFPLRPQEGLFQDVARLQSELSRVLGLKPPTEQIHVFLFSQKNTHYEYLRRYFPEAPYRRALFIKSNGRGMVFVYKHEELDIDVRHECTHALLHASLPMMPLWLDEGLAEYFEMPLEQRAFEHPHLKSIRWSARFGVAPSLERLERIHDLRHMGKEEYRDVWSWTHFMLHGSPEAHDELVRYLADIAAHAPPGDLSKRLRARVPDLERRYLDHFRNWKP